MSIDGATVGHAVRGLRLRLEAYAAADLPQWEQFAAQLRILRPEPGDVLFSAGDAHPYVYYIQSGLLKAKMQVEGGRRSATVFFSEEGDILASMPALGMEGVRRAATRDLHPRSRTIMAAIESQSIHTVTALEPSLLIQGNFRTIDQLATRHVAWARLIASLAVMHATTLQTDVAWLRSTPEMRYRQLLVEHPGLVHRVTQRDLASFLNITDVALSRIVKRVRDADSRVPHITSDPI